MSWLPRLKYHWKYGEIGKLDPANADCVSTSSFTVTTILKALVIILIMPACDGKAMQCSRPHVKQARHIIQKLLHPVFASNEVAIPRSCIFHPGRDMYHANAEHKITEAANRFLCGYCGKAFHEEKFLDDHFDRRHSETVFTGEDAVCLEQVCDVLRCDVTQNHSPAFWHKALCRDASLADRRARCKEHLRTCVPPDLTGWKRDDFHRQVSEALCSKLTCEHYWDPIDPKDSATVMVYIVAAVFLAFALTIYYFLVFAQESEARGEEKEYAAPDHAYLRPDAGVRRRNL